MQALDELLRRSAVRHSHPCPRQVLGVRMGLAGAAALGLEIPRQDKRLLVIAETDGCFLDGLEITCGVAAGRRTLRIEDYGKVAATFVDVKTGDACRFAPKPDVRARALAYAPEESRHYFAQLIGYQVMPDDELFSLTPVVLNTAVTDLSAGRGYGRTARLAAKRSSTSARSWWTASPTVARAPAEATTRCPPAPCRSLHVWSKRDKPFGSHCFTALEHSPV